MKKLVCLILVTVALFSLTGCGTGGGVSETAYSCEFVYGDCEVHLTEYHNIPGQLFDLVEEGQVDEYARTHKGQEFTIVDFVQEMQIPKEDFMRAMGITEENKDEYYPNTAIPDSIIAGDYVDAIYGGNAALTDRVFVRPERRK